MALPQIGSFALLLALGLVWFFQGIGVLKGSFMTGTWFWTVVGVILFGLGLRMVVRARRGAARAP